MIAVDIVIGLIGLGIVIFVHELGHFVAAKACGIAVETFSIGWGKRIAGFTFRGTEYRLSMLPVGGYCRMRGEEQLRTAIEEQSDHIAHEAGSLFSVSPWKRLIVYVSGPLANLLFAAVVMSFVWLVGFSYQSVGNRIVLLSDYPDLAQQSSYPATVAGLRTGDRIVAVNGDPVENFQDLESDIAPYPNDRLVLTVQRGGASLEIPITPQLDKSSGAGIIGVQAWVEPLVGDVQPGSAAAVAGLEKGDTIVSAGGMPIENTVQYMEAFKGQPSSVPITFQRDGATEQTSLIPSYSGSAPTTAGVGFQTRRYHSQASGFADAVHHGVDETTGTLALTVKSIGLLFSGINLGQAVSGPVRITYFVGQIATQGFKIGVGEGFSNLFRFLSVLSVALFFMNLLPIPALDGGLVIIAVGELLSRRSINPRIFYRYQVVGFALIFGLIILTTFSDVFFLIRQ